MDRRTVNPFAITDNVYLKAHTSLISPKATGYVKEVLFQDNQKAMPGNLPLIIDDHDFQARIAQAEALTLNSIFHELSLIFFLLLLR